MEHQALGKFVGTNLRSLRNDGGSSMSLKKMINVKDGVSLRAVQEVSLTMLKMLLEQLDALIFNP